MRQQTQLVGWSFSRMDAELRSYCLHWVGRKGCWSWSWSWTLCCRSLNQAESLATVYLHIRARSGRCGTRHRLGGLAGDRWGPWKPSNPESLLWKPPVWGGFHTCLDPVLRWTDHLKKRPCRKNIFMWYMITGSDCRKKLSVPKLLQYNSLHYSQNTISIQC